MTHGTLTGYEECPHCITTQGGWREQAQALKAAEPSLSNAEIARLVGVTTPAVWKLFNRERALESDRQTRDRRRDRRRQIDREYSARSRSICETCGQPCGVGSGKAGNESRQCQACIRAADEARHRTIIALWNAGKPIREIAVALGTTPNSMQVTIHRLRRKGLVGYRYAVRDGRRVAA